MIAPPSPLLPPQFGEIPSREGLVMLVAKRDDGLVERRFRCHRVVLASMSSYFRSLFTSGMAEVLLASS